ncbi:MAG: hypothetical protein ACD_49C00021G0005 [uncultured bacterium (gcode 4)]|uniref:Lipoprotein n=1 Tax=uncultured bacterium (gcode 4) TaxID=1234023 RepID=K2AFE9_9BACT|nr:MAG: hypothetical protein ACD_49C00021G0005 [uncultured bacterium (gcode 4)]
MCSKTNVLEVKKLLIITLISSSLLLVGCFKEEAVAPTPMVQNQVTENVGTWSVEVSSGAVEEVRNGSTKDKKGYELIDNWKNKTLKIDKMSISLDFPSNLVIQNKSLSYLKENEIEISCSENEGNTKICHTSIEFKEYTWGTLWVDYGEYNFSPDWLWQEQAIEKSDVEKIIKNKSCWENCIYWTIDWIPTSTKIEWTWYEWLNSPVVKKIVYLDNYVLFLNLDINFLLENEYIELQKKFPNAEFPNAEFKKMSDYYENNVKQMKFDEKIINSIKNNSPEDINPKYQKQFDELVKIVNSVKILK